MRITQAQTMKDRLPKFYAQWIREKLQILFPSQTFQSAILKGNIMLIISYAVRSVGLL